MESKRDYYDILKIERNANNDDIKRSFRRLARQYHPDVNREANAETKFKEINEAYKVLSDEQKRAAYDRYGHAAEDGFGTDYSGSGGIGDFFEEIFSGFGGRTSRRGGPRRGADLRYDLSIEFMEAVSGVEKEIGIARDETCTRCSGSGAEPGTTSVTCNTCKGAGEVRRIQQSILGSFVNVSTCPMCRGEGETIPVSCIECAGKKLVRTTRTLTVKIPPGVDSGTQIRLTGEGQPGKQNGPPGNLYVVLNVKPHHFFRRKDNDVVVEIVINVAQAALGDTIEVPTLEAKETLDIPAGTQTGAIFRMRGKGIPYLQRNRRGDQLVIIQVNVPTRLTDEQREMFTKLSKTLGREVIAQNEKGSFMDKLKNLFTL